MKTYTVNMIDNFGDGRVYKGVCSYDILHGGKWVTFKLGSGKTHYFHADTLRAWEVDEE